MRWKSSLRCAAMFAAVGLVFSTAASGQAVRLKQRGARSNLSPNSLSVSATPSLVNFNLVARGAAAGSGPVAILTDYSGTAVPGTIALYAYFTSANAALAGKSVTTIPSSAILGQMTTGLPTTFTAFTQVNPFSGAGAGLKLFSQPIINGTVHRTDALSLKIDLSNLPQLPADTYNGTLIIQVQAF